ncbi:MAG: MobA/MobL family protein [Terrimicrobiaceae bacterium]|nr:MobA/MobL family protein [Terrimicrobiaceae bacterium]
MWRGAGWDRLQWPDERTGQKHDWSKHKADVIESQIIGPAMTPGHLAAAAEGAEKRYDARVGRAMDVALPHELGTKEQWALLRGFGLQLRDTYGCAVCVNLHQPNVKGDSRNTHGHIFMTARAVDEKGNSPPIKSAASMIARPARWKSSASGKCGRRAATAP